MDIYDGGPSFGEEFARSIGQGASQGFESGNATTSTDESVGSRECCNFKRNRDQPCGNN